MRRLCAAAAVMGVVLLVWASPASAHASLESTSPAAGAQLDEAPSEVRLTFSEPVEVSLGGVRVYDANAERVDTGAVHHPSGHTDEVVQSVGELGDGSYVVTWRVVSDDGHPVHGAFTFQVGDRATGDTNALARRLLAADGGSEAVGVAFGLVRFVLFATLVLLVGAAAFCLLAWPEGLGLAAVRRLLWWSWGLAVAATVVSIGAQGAYTGALALSDMVDPDLISSVLDTRYGRVALGRLVLLVLTGVLLGISRRRDGAPLRTSAKVLLGLLGIALLVSLALSGHGAAGDLVPLALPADVIHVGAVALWLGGLVVMLAVALPREDRDELATVVPRFSAIAFGCVAALVITGSFQAWRQVGSVDALTSTTYGHLLLVKLGLFVVMVAFGYLGRRWVQRGYAQVDPDQAVDDDVVVAGYGRSIRVETGVGLAILAVTALLVNAQPARQALAQPYSAELAAGDLLVDLTIDPAKAGPAEFHVYTLTDTGAVADVDDLTLELSLPSQGIGPLTIPLQRAGPGHFSAYDVDLPIAGDWTIDVRAVVDQFDEVEAHDTVHVRGG